MKNKLFFCKNIFTALAWIFCFLSSHAYAQEAPANKRLLQLNTAKGSRLLLTKTTDNFMYHLGSTNSGEIGIDGLTSSSAASDDDLFILKSNVTNGSNVWLKTFTAGTDGSIVSKYAYVDSSENIYVYGSFSGTISVGNFTATSSAASSLFLMKLDSGGNAIWINQLEGNFDALFPKVKCVTDGTDTFLIYNRTHLVRINDQNGAVLYNKTYNDVELKSVALHNSNLYVAGASVAPLSLGTESVSSPRTGFVVKGDKDANFTASATAALPDPPAQATDISDIAFTSEGRLLVTGFSVGPMRISAEGGNFEYTYNPNSVFENNRIYHYVANLDAELNSVSFLRTSSPVSTDAAYFLESRIISATIENTGVSGNFGVIVSNNYYNVRNSIKSFTNINETVTNIDYISTGGNNYKHALFCDAAGNSLLSYTPQTNGLLSSANNDFSSSILSGRLFTTYVYSLDSGTSWSKNKTSSIGGSLSHQFQQHLYSEKADMFVTSHVEGTANFFGKTVNNNSGKTSRYVARLGADGIAKWHATFHPDSGTEEFHVYKDFAAVDQDDNFIFLANTSGAKSILTDASGSSFSFTQPEYLSTKVLIKMDKMGNHLWSKQMRGLDPSVLSTDGEGNVHMIGTYMGDLSINGTTVLSTGSVESFYMLKFSPAGDLLYSKSYLTDYGFWTARPVFDAENNLYLFMDPINYNNSSYVLGNVTLPSNPNQLDYLMFKFDSDGNPVSGKNFYANLPMGIHAYGWALDVVFDGTDFILMGIFSKGITDINFVGLDLTVYQQVYPSLYLPFFAKVSTSGEVIWQKPVHDKGRVLGNYTNIDLDENKNIYKYWYTRDKLTYNGTEFSFDATSGNKVLTKIDTDGNLKYIKSVDVGYNNYPYIDVLGDDKITVSGFTDAHNLLNYPVNAQKSTNFYIATFGDLPTKYLTPVKNYLQLTNVGMTNNPNDDNTFSFDLINNVDWNAVSDQNWLTLSFQSLTGKNELKNMISGNGDAKINMTAQTNNSGSTRTANVLVSGTGVNSKTVIVTQTNVLATGEPKTIITTLYPNPTSDVLNIETQQKISKIEIYDLSGKLLNAKDGKDKKISVSGLNKGLYLIKLYTENGIIASKFIKN